MISNHELAKFGAAVAAIVTFYSGSFAVAQRICDAAPAGLDLDDRDQARELCSHYGLDRVEMGDTVRVMFDQPVTGKKGDIRSAVVKWHDSRHLGDGEVDEHTAASELIEQLLGFSGIHIAT
ncbi:hypothetical protein [Microbacterium sp. NPDC055665]